MIFKHAVFLHKLRFDKMSILYANRYNNKKGVVSK